MTIFFFLYHFSIDYFNKHCRLDSIFQLINYDTEFSCIVFWEMTNNKLFHSICLQFYLLAVAKRCRWWWLFYWATFWHTHTMCYVIHSFLYTYTHTRTQTQSHIICYIHSYHQPTLDILSFFSSSLVCSALLFNY